MFNILNEQQNLQYSTNKKKILLTFDDNYVDQSINLIMSIVAYNSKCDFICVCTQLSQNNIQILLEMNVGIKIVTVSVDFDIDTKKWPITTIFRLFAPWILDESISDILYMDSDILCTGDISELLFFQPKCIAMGTEISGCVRQTKLSYFYNTRPFAQYCNAGVAKINLDTLRKEYTLQSFYEAFSSSNSFTQLVDQDFLNIHFHERMDIINGFRYNFQAYELLGSVMYKKALKECRLIHFSVGKPWNYKTKRALIKLYYKHTKYSVMKKKIKKILGQNLVYLIYSLPRRTASAVYHNIIKNG